MKFFIVTIFCNLFSSGLLQQTNNVDGYNSVPPDVGKSDWPAQTFHTVQGNFYGQAQRTGPEIPCSRRSLSGTEPISQQLSSPLSIKIDPSINAAAPLEPQALRHEEFNQKTSSKQVPPSNPQHIIDSSNLLNKRNFLITNPVIDSTEELVPPITNEIQEDNHKPPERSTPTSDSLSASSRGDKTEDNSRDQQEPVSVLRVATDNNYGTHPENDYISALEFKGLRRPQKTVPSEKEFPGYVANLDATEAQTLPPSLIAKLLFQPEAAAVMQSNKCTNEKEPDYSRRSMSSYNDEDNAEAISRNDKDYSRSNNDPYHESNIENENALASVMNAENTTTKPNNGQSLRILDTPKTPTHGKSVSRTRPPFNEARREMIEPTKGFGLMGQSALMMMQSERICYACSTVNNPSCWTPDRRTTVKYCRKGNNACITKTFGEGSAFTLIRDCGKSCDDDDLSGLMPKYKSCSMCHSELCNGAYSINGQNIIFALFLIALAKYFN